MDVMKLLIILCLLCVAVQSIKVKLLESCSSNEDCPSQSSCKERGCDGRVCICQNTYMPSESDTPRCVKITEIGDRCDRSSRCRGLYSRCNDTGHCVCNQGYSEVVSRINITYCKQKPIFQTKPLLLGQRCGNGNSFCADGFQTTECRRGVCECIDGYRPANLPEINSYPFHLLQCVPAEFSIDKPVSSNLCFQKGIPASTFSPHTTTSTPTSQNTSTQTTSTQHYVTTTSGTVSSYITGSISTILPITKETVGRTSSPAKYHAESSSSIQQSPGSLKHSSSIQPTSSLLKQSIHTNSDHFSSTPVINSFTKSMSSKELITSSYSKSSEVEIFTSKSLQISQTVDIEKTSSGHHTYKLTETPLMSNPITTIHPSIQVSILNTGISLNLLSSSMISKPSRHTIYLDLITTSYNLVPLHSLSASSSVLDINSNTPSLKSVGATRFQTTASQSTTDGPYIFPESTFSVTMTSSMQTVTSARETTIQNLPTGKTTETTTPNFPTTENNETTTNNLPTVDNTDTKTTLSLTKVSDGKQCNSVTHICIKGGICEEDLCGESRCRCERGFVPNLNKSRYLKLGQLGNGCEEDVSCMGPFTVCRAGTCRCKDDYVTSSNALWCTHKTSWFVKFPLLGNSCSSFFAECFHSLEQECVKGKCQCKKGLRSATDEDNQVPSDTYHQCRNDSLQFGHREPRACRGGAEDDISDPIYRTAIKRIRKMQGIIFGCIAGIVVAICSIIGGICYCRYQRKVMVRDMTSDKNSVVSFDRQSSGKYSFRIPRPFMPYIKDWDTDQLTYANSAFTSDDNEVLKGDRTLRSSRSITLPDESDTEGYNRPNDRQRTLSTSSTVEGDITSVEGETDKQSIGGSQSSLAKSYQANHIILEPENVEV
ncbi:agrin-like [Mytilus trossulus]|uniref:agrin-like n=1 Tax=Mytilus trossulus TaxID=6551 RepID=UPI003004854A